MKKKIIFCLFPFIILFSLSLSPAIFSIDPVMIKQRYNDVDQYSIYSDKIDFLSSGWPLRYNHSIEDVSTNVILDSQENVIVTGFTYNESREEFDFLTVKYSPDGSVIWYEMFNVGTNDYSWDAEIDSQDNIIIFGFNSSLNDDPDHLNITLYLMKYDSNGLLQWNKTLKWDKDCFPGGIAIDSNDHIILTLGSGDLDMMQFSCITIKYDTDGNEIWKKIFAEDMLSFGSNIVVNENDDIIVGGLSASFFGQGWFLLKYDENGEYQWVQRYSGGGQPYDLELDPWGNLIFTGQIYVEKSNSSGWLTLKCDSFGNLLWKYEYDGLYHEYPSDAAIDSQGNIYILGHIVGDDFSESCFILHDPDGEEICMKKPCVDAIFLGLTVDKNDQVIATGVINASDYSYNGDFYTDVIVDFTPPVFETEKPRQGYVYLFDKELISLGKNAIAIGKLTMRIKPTDEAEVNKVMFYIDGILMETIETSPYEFVWDESGFGLHNIEIHVYDDNGTMKREIQSIWKIF